MIYLFVLFLLFVLSFHYDVNGKTQYRNNWYIVVLIIFVLLAGLRYRIGVDTHRYLYYFYHDYPLIDEFSIEDLQIGEDPLYVLLNSIIRSLGGRFYMVQLIQAAFVNILILNYFKKHSDNIFTCALFYFVLSYSGLMMEIMRASFSVAICLYANDYIREKKWLKGYLLYFIATLFHAQTLVLLVLPFLFFIKLNKKGILILLLSYFVGVILMQSIGDYVFLLEEGETIESKISDYAQSENYGKNSYNIGYYIVTLLPLVVYPLFSIWFCKRFSENEKIKSLEPFILLGVIFVIIQSSFIIAYRYVDYFRIYFALIFAETTVCMVKRNLRLKLNLSYVIALLFYFPLLFLNFSKFYDDIYMPYSSVIEKSIVEDRENRFQKLGIDLYFPPKPNEY